MRGRETGDPTFLSVTVCFPAEVRSPCRKEYAKEWKKGQAETVTELQ